MLPVPPHLRFLLYPHATDMRKSFDGLSGLVTNGRLGSPTSGDVYIFINRRRDRMKLLVWEQSGFWLIYKRLEAGTFQIPANPATHPVIELSWETLLMLVEGIDFTRLQRRHRYRPNPA